MSGSSHPGHSGCLCSRCCSSRSRSRSHSWHCSYTHTAAGSHNQTVPVDTLYTHAQLVTPTHSGYRLTWTHTHSLGDTLTRTHTTHSLGHTLHKHSDTHYTHSNTHYTLTQTHTTHTLSQTLPHSLCSQLGPMNPVLQEQTPLMWWQTAPFWQ